MITKDGWLSEQLDKPVFNVSEDADLSWDFTTHGLYCYRTDSEKSLTVAIQKGFDLISVTVRLERSLAKEEEVNNRVCSSYVVSRDRILDMAENCFVYDRFHKDPMIDKKKASNLKKNWVANCLDWRRGDFVFQRYDGFLCSLIKESGKGKIAIIDLIGVDSKMRSRGIGVGMINSFFYYYAYFRGINTFAVSTQLDNLPSLALYRKCGFKIVGHQYILHLHT